MTLLTTLKKLTSIKKIDGIDTFEKINTDEIINKNHLKLVFEEDENGKLAKYSFAKLNNDGNIVVLHSGKVLSKNKNQYVCSTEVVCRGYSMSTAFTSTNVGDMFCKYSNNPTLVAMQVDRCLTAKENEQFDVIKKKLIESLFQEV